jgi:hypothetical protein
MLSASDAMNILLNLNIPLFIVFACFVGLGVGMRRQNKKDWRAFLYGGIVLLTIVILAAIFGWRL